MRPGSHEWVEYCIEKYGLPAFGCGGASADMKAGQTDLSNITKMLQGDLGTFFADNSAILSNLTGSLSPIEAAGPEQYGFSSSEDSAMRAQATEAIASNARATTDTTRSVLAAQGGGNTYLPSGSEATIEAGEAQTEAQEQATAQQQITQAGYQTGRQNYWAAVQGLGSAPSETESPVTQAGEAATGAGSAYEGAATAVTQANQAPLNAIGGIIGGGLGAALGQGGAITKMIPA